MRRFPLRLVVAVWSALAVAGCAGGSSPPRVTNAPAREGLGRGDGFDVVQRAGVALWSRRSHDGYRLVIRRASRAPELVAVAPSPFAFDADLGTDAAGRTLAVYSRCAAGRSGRRGLRGFRTRCGLFALDVRTEVERELGEVARPGFSHVRPAIDRGILAFAELPDAGAARGKCRVLLKRLGTPAPPRPVMAFDGYDPGNVLGIDYENERLAFALAEGEDDDLEYTTLYLKEPGGRVRRLARGGFGEENAQIVTSPSFAGAYLYSAFSNRGGYLKPNGFVVRYDLRTRRLATDAVPGHLVAVAADAAVPSRGLLMVSDRRADPNADHFGTQRLRRVRHASFEEPPAGLGLRDTLGLATP